LRHTAESYSRSASPSETAPQSPATHPSTPGPPPRCDPPTSRRTSKTAPESTPHPSPVSRTQSSAVPRSSNPRKTKHQFLIIDQSYQNAERETLNAKSQNPRSSLSAFIVPRSAFFLESSLVNPQTSPVTPSDPRSDRELIAALNRGDTSAFDVLYFRYR